MTLRTLDELNCDFMANNPSHSKITEFEPITPLVIEVELPESMKHHKNERTGMKNLATHRNQQSSIRAPQKRGLITSISDVLFSLAIVMILFVVLFSGTESGMPKTIFNYSYFTVVSPSMQDEIPQGSFILVKSIDPHKLKVGDNITYMADRSISVTHKIIKIYENYDNSGVLGFQTKGVNNTNPDQDIVYEANIVGKVVFVLPIFGLVLSHLSENVFLVFIVFGLCVLLSFLLRGIFTKPTKRIAPENN